MLSYANDAILRCFGTSRDQRLGLAVGMWLYGARQARSTSY